jgi:hypothetical protein
MRMGNYRYKTVLSNLLAPAPGSIYSPKLAFTSQGIVWDKQHPVLKRKDRMGSPVERAGFGWKWGKVLGR